MDCIGLTRNGAWPYNDNDPGLERDFFNLVRDVLFALVARVGRLQLNEPALWRRTHSLFVLVAVIHSGELIS